MTNISLSPLWRTNATGAILPGMALIAIWMATSLLYALLLQPATTLTTLQERGTRGVPAVVWAGSRDLARYLAGGQTERGHE